MGMGWGTNHQRQVDDLKKFFVMVHGCKRLASLVDYVGKAFYKVGPYERYKWDYNLYK